MKYFRLSLSSTICTKKSRAKKDILKLLQYVQEPDTLLKLDSMYKNVNKVMGFLGLFE